MAFQNFTNYPSSTLNGSITAGQFTLTITSTVGFPTAPNFQLLLDQNEIVQVTGVAGNVYTITRAFESLSGVQSAFAHSNGAPVVLVLTTQSLNLGFVRGDGPGIASLDQYGNKINPGVTVVGGLASGISVFPTLTAVANNDALAIQRNGDSVNKPTIASGTFTGLSVYGHFVDGANIQKTGTGTIANAYGLYITNPSIGTNNYAAYFGGPIMATPSSGGTLAPTSYGTVPVKIAEQVTGSAVASVTFSSIPTGFRHLLLVCTARDTVAGTGGLVWNLRLNADAGTNYDAQRLYAVGATVTGQELSASATSGGAVIAVSGGVGAGIMGENEILFPNYSSVTNTKTWVSKAILKTGTGASTTYVHEIVGHWNSTAAINSIQITGGTAIDINNIFTLYGIP